MNYLKEHRKNLINKYLFSKGKEPLVINEDYYEIRIYLDNLVPYITTNTSTKEIDKRHIYYCNDDNDILIRYDKIDNITKFSKKIINFIEEATKSKDKIKLRTIINSIAKTHYKSDMVWDTVGNINIKDFNHSWIFERLE